MEGDEKKPVEETEKVEEKQEEIEQPADSEEDQSEKIPDTEEGSEDQSEKQPDEEPENVVVIDGEEMESDIGEELKSDSEPIKDIRKKFRDHKKKKREVENENRELKKKIESLTASEEQTLDPGPEPEPEDEGIDYDMPTYKARIREWDKKVAAQAEAVKKEKAHQKEQEQLFGEKVEVWRNERQKLVSVFDDVEEAEKIAHSILSDVQIQKIVEHAGKKSALVIYQLGKKPELAKKYSEIKNSEQFAINIVDLGKKMEVTQRKPATKPEQTLSGGGPVMNAGDKELTRLRKDAEASGDYTKVIAYKAKQKKQA